MALCGFLASFTTNQPFFDHFQHQITQLLVLFKLVPIITSEAHQIFGVFLCALSLSNQMVTFHGKLTLGRRSMLCDL